MTVVIDGTSGVTTPGVVNTAAQTIATTLAVTGVTTIAAGSAAAPALVSTTGGATTGVWFPATDTVAVSTGGTERSRITSVGELLVGATAATNAGKVISFFNSAANVGFVANDTTATAGATYFIASNNGTSIGSIARVGGTSAVVYNTTSDQRLKSNITDSNSVLPILMDVRVRQFDWIEGAVHQDYGFIAQELEPVLSGVVTKGKTDEDVWQLDYSKLTPHLLKAIQEQQTLILALTARITALEGVA
jgi:hypothetical protein